MTVPKLACLEPIKLALKSALTKFNIGRCLPAWKKRAYGDMAEEMFTALEAAPAVSCIRNDTVTSPGSQKLISHCSMDRCILESLSGAPG
jgi:hypothetical protein